MAASASEGPLSEDEIDEVLGVMRGSSAAVEQRPKASAVNARRF